MRRQHGFFDEDDRLTVLSRMGDPLEKAAAAVDFEGFRPILDQAFDTETKGPGGRPRFDPVMMFKILLLQQWYGISDDAAEYQINDRLSFQRFLGLGLSDKVPDAKTIWLFREELTRAGVLDQAFDWFTAQLEKEGLVTRRGSILDATFVDAPRQRNTRGENATIKDGQMPAGWDSDGPAARHRLSQKDLDARWTIKNTERHYGYKDHVKVDQDSKLITAHAVTDASVHDSKALIGLVDDNDQVLYADSAYVGEKLHDQVWGVNPGLVLRICEKGYRNKSLTEAQKTANAAKSRVRARVEHVFAEMTTAMGGIVVRSVGIVRARAGCALRDLAYNIRRYETITRLNLLPKAEA